MHLKSLGYQSELIFPNFEGEVTDRGHYLRIRTPLNPTYWWGNYLLFEKAPELGDFERWTELFKQEIGEPPQTEHMLFAWDISQDVGAIKAFIEVGFELQSSVVMTASTVHLPSKVNKAIEMRSLNSEADFAELLELECLLGLEDGFEAVSHRVFLERKQLHYHKMIKAGLGQWFGAYLEGKLVAHMGLFHNNKIARYQTVGTHPEYRRQGIAGTLVYFVGQYGFEHFGVENLVMIADDHYFAKHIYASVGFKETELIYALERAPKSAKTQLT